MRKTAKSLENKYCVAQFLELEMLRGTGIDIAATEKGGNGMLGSNCSWCS